jgi:hypothetical protein
VCQFSILQACILIMRGLVSVIVRTRIWYHYQRLKLKLAEKMNSLDTPIVIHEFLGMIGYPGKCNQRFTKIVLSLTKLTN